MCLSNVMNGVAGGMEMATSNIGSGLSASSPFYADKQRAAEAERANSLYADTNMKNDSIKTRNEGLGDRRAGAMGIASTRAALMAQEKVQAVKQTLGA